MLGRDNSEHLELIRGDIRSTIVFMMELDAKGEAILDHFDIDYGNEQETED